MALRLVTAPVVPAVPIPLAMLNLRIDDQPGLMPLIEAWVAGVTEHAEHLLGRALITQKWRLTQDQFSPVLRLRKPPVASVESVSYIDETGATVVMDSTDFVADLASEPGRILPPFGKTWPRTARQPNAVTVSYTCGYGDDSNQVPQAIRTYILAKLVEQFDPSVRLEKDTIQSTFLDRMLDRYVLMEVA